MDPALRQEVNRFKEEIARARRGESGPGPCCGCLGGILDAIVYGTLLSLLYYFLFIEYRVDKILF
jgi:hypothetical protein